VPEHSNHCRGFPIVKSPLAPFLRGFVAFDACRVGAQLAPVQALAIANAAGMAIDICEQFGANLRRIRRKPGFTQEELAHRVGMDVSYLSELENGRKRALLAKDERNLASSGHPVGTIAAWSVT
jgi:hypothetical protein